jgi:DNA mismatch endonuclease, patch repair protein
MRSNRSKDTRPEVALRAALRAAGLTGYRKNVRALPGTPDLVFGPSRLAVFVHGCFWHGCTLCGKVRTPATNRAFWEEKVARNRARHDRAMTELETQGWRSLTVWECELKADLAGVVGRIQAAIQDGLS